MNEREIEETVRIVRRLLAKSNARAHMIRPAKDVTKHEDNWKRFEASETTYLLLVSGPEIENREPMVLEILRMNVEGD